MLEAHSVTVLFSADSLELTPVVIPVCGLALTQLTRGLHTSNSSDSLV